MQNALNPIASSCWQAAVLARARNPLHLCGNIRFSLVMCHVVCIDAGRRDTLYNAQVLNDLLDPSRANLKLREDPKRGFYVEGIKEETLVSAEHALSVIATGVAHRKVRTTHLLTQTTSWRHACQMLLHYLACCNKALELRHGNEQQSS